MQTLCTAAQLRTCLAPVRRAGQSIGLVPTMGYFHQGHLALMREAHRQEGVVVVSLFVNPTQFGPQDDLARYPRDPEGDARAAAGVGVDVLFTPSEQEMYGPADSTWVTVTGTLVEGLCGPHRPGHFRGVATVVCKLFGLVQPDRAYFGEKDYQQLQVIRHMTADLKLPIEIVPVPTVREADGLAMSSRNAYLDPQERAAAPILYRALQVARQAVEHGERMGRGIVARASEIIAQEPRLKLQYLELVDADTLAPLPRLDRPGVLAVAAYLGTTRLIDNIRLDPGKKSE